MGIRRGRIGCWPDFPDIFQNGPAGPIENRAAGAKGGEDGNGPSDDERSNYESFTDYFLPSDLGAVDVKDTSLGLASGATKDGDVLETATEQVRRCTARCWVKTVIVSLVNVPMLIVVGGILIVFLRFSRAQSKRLANELQLVRQQLAQEHLDKIRLLRVAGITLD